jgi:hypothetical protein
VCDSKARNSFWSAQTRLRFSFETKAQTGLRAPKLVALFFFQVSTQQLTQVIHDTRPLRCRKKRRKKNREKPLAFVKRKYYSPAP